MALKKASSVISNTIPSENSTTKTPSAVHCKRTSYDVYIGRPSKYGNPFSHLPDSAGSVKVSSRDEAVDNYRKWVLGEMTVPGLIPPSLDDIRRDLAGKVLGCWCAPNRCHGDVLVELANSPMFTPDEPSGP